jgi:hypothetical protein
MRLSGIAACCFIASVAAFAHSDRRNITLMTSLSLSGLECSGGILAKPIAAKRMAGV